MKAIQTSDILGGFQPATDQNIRMNCNEKIPTHLSAWPRKLTAVMDIHRQRFSELNPRFKQRNTAATLSRPVQQPVVYPVILPSTPRPQHRQQARPKQAEQNHISSITLNQRSNTAHAGQHQTPTESNSQYITLANLTRILHVLQTQDKLTDNETTTNSSTSTTNSAKQRVQQHLQETATRWWKPVRSYESQSLAASSVNAYATSSTMTQLPLTHHLPQKRQQSRESDNLPLLTVVSNSTHQFNPPSTRGKNTSQYDDSESSTEIQSSTIITSIVQSSTIMNTKHLRQEPLIMQSRGMRLHSHDHHHYNKQNKMNFFQQQRLIRQT